MRIMRVLALLVVVGGLARVPELTAQSTTLEITPFAGGTFFLADPPSRFALHRDGTTPLVVEDGSYDPAPLLGIHAGVRWSERFAVEGMFSWMPTTLAGTQSDLDADALMYGATFLLAFPMTNRRWEPYVGLGIGGETYNYDLAGLETHSHLAGIAAVGLNVDVTDRFGLRFDARDCFVRMDSGVAGIDDAWESDLMLSVGLNFHLPLGG